MNDSEMLLVEMQPNKKRTRTHVWESDRRFVAGWWEPESIVNGNERWVAMRRGGEEVARCKLAISEDELDILAIEVASGLHGQGIGRALVDAIRKRYAHGRRMRALSAGVSAHGFWDSLGWSRETPVDDPMFAGIVTAATAAYFVEPPLRRSPGRRDGDSPS